MDTDTRTALIANVTATVYSSWVMASGRPDMDPTRCVELAKVIVDLSREAATGIVVPGHGSAAAPTAATPA